MRKNISRLFILVLALTLAIPAFLLKGEATKAVTKKNISVKTTVGFNDKYKIGYFTTMNMDIKNDYKDIQGTVEVRVPTAQNKYNVYTKSLSMQKGSEKVIAIDVPVKQGFLKYQIVIKDGKDEVFTDEVKVGNTTNQTVKFLGILSDDFDSLTYFNKVPAAKGITFSTEQIKLDEKNFPENIQVLQAFDVIVINNFDTSKLSKEAYDNLKKWVNLGGTLVIGTGTNYNKTLGIFKDDFIKGKPGQLTNINTNQIYSIATNGDNKNSVSLEALDISLENGIPNIQEGSFKLLQTIKIGSGSVGVASFDFGLKPFTGWANNSAFEEKVLDMVNEDFSKNYRDSAYMEQYYTIDQLLRDLNNRDVNINNFVIVLLIYIVLVAPVSYIILKKMDKREFMWITVPCISLVFGIIIYFLGSGSRLADVTTNNANIITVESTGVANKNTYSGIFTPKKMIVEASGKNGEKLDPIDNPNYGGDQSNIQLNEVDTIVKEDKGTLEFRNKSVLTPKVLKMPSINVNVGKIETDIVLDGSDIKGTVKNNTSYNFDYCFIITPHQYYKVGTVKKGESISIPAKTGTYGGNIDELVYNTSLVGRQSNGRQSAEDSSNTQLLRAAFSEGSQKFSGNVTGITIIGISKDTASKPLLVNGKDTLVKDRTVIKAPVKVNFKNGDNITYPAGYVDSQIVGAVDKYDDYNQVFFGPSTPEVLYMIDKSMVVTDIDLNLNTVNGKGSANVSREIYNYKEDKYENLSKDKLSGDDIGKYVNKNNEMKLRFNLSNSQQCERPAISVKGKVK
ncbi:hypothetical protein [Clostridium sp. C8-1-8]|uniref:hypothetical protein n=1 Tax=Clostridium sp. C8-1-8 TaxID=2698831 RepID=UPI001369BB7F|nr:hypothetical protein [Clostridium sp. C8-1-8]